MNKFKLVLMGLLLSVCACANAQEWKEKTTQEVAFKTLSPHNLLVVKNDIGALEIEGWSGQTVQIEAERIIRASNEEGLKAGKGSITFHVFKNGMNEFFFDLFKVNKDTNAIYVYLLSPGSLRDEKTGDQVNGEESKDKYEFTLNLRIKVPSGTNLELRTNTGGNIIVRNTAGRIKATHTQGSIVLNNVSGPTHVTTNKGDVTVQYRQNPSRECSYATTDGNINVTYPAGLAADVTYRAGGSLHSDFTASALRPGPGENGTPGKTSAGDQPGSQDSFRIGAGGVKMNFSAPNGNVTINRLGR